MHSEPQVRKAPIQHQLLEENSLLQTQNSLLVVLVGLHLWKFRGKREASKEGLLLTGAETIA